MPSLQSSSCERLANKLLQAFENYFLRRRLRNRCITGNEVAVQTSEFTTINTGKVLYHSHPI
jgi:hypothetical protein